ncbi:MAG: FAD-dependent oxidoreductase [Beijerinckiaceae bacterium]|nr:FAD-dependent oxidoreductase [Beijerinckiaceae bacterium]
MKEIKEPARLTPVIAETDVLVVGSGPGGLAAAISSARAGVKTMLVERYGCLGGNLTHVGVEGIAWYRQERTVDVEGIGIEFEHRAKTYGAASPEPQSLSHAINAEMFKAVADCWVQEAGVETLLHAHAVGAVRDGGTLQGIIIESKSGRHAILAKRIVDATGDADIAALCGVPCRKTPKEDMLAVTVMFSCSGVDRARFLAYVAANPKKYKDWGKNWEIITAGKEDELFSPYLEEPFDMAREKGIIPPGLKSIGGTWSAINDHGEATYLNMVHMLEFDGTDVFDLTRAEMEGRRQAMLAIKALQCFAPGFENAALRNFGMTIGIRDTRKIIGRYNLTGEDVRGEARFDDAIGIFPEFIDGYGILVLPTTGRYFHVPYGSLVPQEIGNLLIAGRSIAGDKVSHAAVRNMMCCTVTGQGAGIAAAVSLKTGVSTAQVRIADIQAELRRQGVRYS